MYRSWLDAYKLAKEYYEEHGDLLIPQSYKVDGYNLGTWINNQRIKYKNNELSEEKIKLLEEINMAWNTFFSREIKPLNQNRIKLELLKELNKVLEEYKEDYIFDKKDDLEEINNNLILKLK